MVEKLKVLFDDGCPMCRTGKTIAETLDRSKNVEFIGMNTENGKSLIASNSLDMNESAYALHANGKTTRGPLMIRDVLAYGGTLGAVLSSPFCIPYFSDALYALLARIRRILTSSKT